jgi:hypothetical protein
MTRYRVICEGVFLEVYVVDATDADEAEKIVMAGLAGQPEARDVGDLEVLEVKSDDE